MKVLHLPTNIASQMSVTVRALRDIGAEARGIVLNKKIIQSNEGLECYEYLSPEQPSVQSRLKSLIWARKLISAINWADVIHWYSHTRTLPKDLDLRLIAAFNKPRIVEFWGSEVRIPEIASLDNPYRAKMYQENPDLQRGAKEKSINTQSRFARYGFECLVPGVETATYIQENIFPKPYFVKTRLISSEFIPAYPDPDNSKPVIVHSPSHKALKGTQTTLETIEALRGKYDFIFKLIHNVERFKALQILRESDIFLDQFIAGSYGIAALEAMAFGKPTFCYINPSMEDRYPIDLPIVNANQDDLPEVLSTLLENGEKRYQIGRLSRAYFEKYHDAHKIANQLLSIYQELIAKNK
jgi:glycosyltransferase involved in cell wall biosynthesis